MEINNLASPGPTTEKSQNLTVIIVIITVAAIAAGFWLSRLAPPRSGPGIRSINNNGNQVIPADKIQQAKDVQVGKTYGNIGVNYKDTAVGVVEKGSINGEGTHILNREGGLTQRASLTSSAVDLDLFIGKKVEIKGETNSSNKTAWLLDVGSIKILE